MSVSHEQAEAFAAALGPLVPEIVEAVEPAYPHEGCGFVFSDDERLYVAPTANRAQLLHEKNPERYPRGGADWFEPDMKPWLHAQRAGHRPRVIFHSHPDVGAYFSQGDHDSAVVADEHGVEHERHPGVLHLVVSVRNGRADDAALFRWDAGAGRFAEVVRFTPDGAVRA